MLRAAAVSILLSALCVWPFGAAQEPSLAEVLKRAAAYVAGFQKQLSGIAAEETYEQHIKKQASGDILVRRRRLKSGLLLVRPVGSGRSDADLGFMVPADMREAYFAGRDEIEGAATYGRLRKFQVSVDEQIKPVKQ